MSTFRVLIPAYNPGQELDSLVRSLLMYERISEVIIIDDGSKQACSLLFQGLKSLSPKVTLLQHAVNMGKGAALKMGLNHAYTKSSDDVGVVTVDADGQHRVEDVLRVGNALLAHPGELIMGTRQFQTTTDHHIPLRSKIGNLLTVRLFQMLVGKKISDTQSGLRGIPSAFIPLLLTINQNGYEFELNMLICCKNTHREIHEVPIETIYHNNNQSSHFNPILDSLRIYFVLFRFLLLSFSTFLLDFSIFSLLSMQGFSLITCQLLSRVCGALYNYPLAKRMVFRCREQHQHHLMKFMTLVLVNFGLSLVVIHFFVNQYGFNPIVVKMVVESMLCLANFAIQRDLIFSNKWSYDH